MVLSLALHVYDEAVSGFLPFYNQWVLDLRARLGFFPAPTFTFPVWITGLVTAILIAAALTPIVARGGRPIRLVCGAVAVVMVANALGHMLGSMYFGTILPGFWSAPLLLATSLWMARRALFAGWQDA